MNQPLRHGSHGRQEAHHGSSISDINLRRSKEWGGGDSEITIWRLFNPNAQGAQTTNHQSRVARMERFAQS
jgi:hypothetical protein